MVYTGLCADCLCSSFIVPGQHHHTNAHVLHLFHCLWTVFLDHICHRNDTGEHAVLCKKQRCLSFFCQTFCLSLQFLRYSHLTTDKFHTASKQCTICHRCLQAIARQCLEVADFCKGKLLFLLLFHDGLCQWMLATLFQRGCFCKQLGFTVSICRQNIRDLWGSACNGTGLIQCHDLHSACFL